MRITSKGQVTIPVEIREKLGFLPDTEVEFVIVGSEVRLRKKKGKRTRGQSIISHLKGRATVPMSTDEILSLTRGN